MGFLRRPAKPFGRSTSAPLFGDLYSVPTQEVSRYMLGLATCVRLRNHGFGWIYRAGFSRTPVDAWGLVQFSHPGGFKIHAWLGNMRQASQSWVRLDLQSGLQP